MNYDDLCDIYQDAFIVLRRHAIEGKLTTVKSSLKTYLFGIGKNMIYKKLQKLQKHNDYINSEKSKHNDTSIVDFEKTHDTPNLQQRLLNENFLKLGKKCQDLLTLFYSRGLTIDEIVQFTDYTNDNVVRSQKSRCLKRLKELIS